RAWNDSVQDNDRMISVRKQNASDRDQASIGPDGFDVLCARIHPERGNVEFTSMPDLAGGDFIDVNGRKLGQQICGGRDRFFKAPGLRETLQFIQSAGG